jgi:hypothetical protein
MLRYFFHVIDGEELPDNVGTVLSNADEARAEAIVLSGAMLKAKGVVLQRNRLCARIIPSNAYRHTNAGPRTLDRRARQHSTDCSPATWALPAAGIGAGSILILA